MQKFAAVASVAAALMLSGGAAQAQGQDAQGARPFSIRVGTYIPLSNDASDPGGRTMFAIGADYTFADNIDQSRRSYSQVSISYIGSNNMSMIPITLTQIFQPTEAGRPANYYFGGGFGLYVTSIEQPFEDGRDKTLVGGFLVGGLNVTHNMFAEVRYHVISRYNDRRLDGLQVSIGGRF